LDPRAFTNDAEMGYYLASGGAFVAEPALFSRTVLFENVAHPPGKVVMRLARNNAQARRFIDSTRGLDY
jgi:hypothetical protein